MIEEREKNRPKLRTKTFDRQDQRFFQTPFLCIISDNLRSILFQFFPTVRKFLHRERLYTGWGEGEFKAKFLRQVNKILKISIIMYGGNTGAPELIG